MAEITFSIITVNLNHAQGLQKTMSSVFEQSYKNSSYIVIDGASTDESVALIQSQKENINYWVSEPDKNAYEAMNKGIAAATGNFLIFLNSGDYFYSPETLKNLALSIKNYPSEIYYTNVALNFKEKVVLKNYPTTLSQSFFFKTSLCHQTTVFSKSLFDKYGKYNEKYPIVADWLFLLQCFNNKVTFTHLPALVLAYFDPYGLSSDYALNQAQRQMAIAEQLPALLPAWKKAQQKLRWSYRLNKLANVFKREQ